MINEFDSSHYRTSEPQTVSVGEFWAWKRTDISAVYDTSEFTLKYFFYLQGKDETRFEVVASKVDDVHVVEVPAATTTQYKAGEYIYTVIIERDSDSERKKISQGSMTLRPALDTDNGDIRTHAQKVLDAIEATIEGVASKQQQSYSIAGRSLSRYSHSDLLMLRKTYQERVNKERKKALRRSGKRSSNSVSIVLGA